MPQIRTKKRLRLDGKREVRYKKGYFGERNMLIGPKSIHGPFLTVNTFFFLL